jgi:hypothetical protein
MKAVIPVQFAPTHTQSQPVYHFEEARSLDREIKTGSVKNCGG